MTAKQLMDWLSSVDSELEVVLIGEGGRLHRLGNPSLELTREEEHTQGFDVEVVGLPIAD
jgi:hypothetical protein